MTAPKITISKPCREVPPEDVLAERRWRWQRSRNEVAPSLVFVTCRNRVCAEDTHLTITPLFPPYPPEPEASPAEPEPIRPTVAALQTVLEPPPAPPPALVERHAAWKGAIPKTSPLDQRNRKLTISQVRVIRAMTGPFTKAHETRFGVSAQTLRNIRDRKTWTWLPE